MRQTFCRHSFPYVPFTFVNHPGSWEKFIKSTSDSLYEIAFWEQFLLIFELSAALWVYITAFECTLREHLNLTLNSILRTNQWWNTSSLFSKRELRRINEYKSIYLSKRKAAPSLQFQDIPSLSFWLTLISNKYGHRIWRHFENQNPSLRSYGRRNFQQKTLIIKDLRNAIAHHAPILHRNLQRDLAYIQELISLLSPPLAIALNKNSNALSLIAQQKSTQKVKNG